MRLTAFLFLVGLLSSFSIQAQDVQYDSSLAKELGADDYGMKMYVMVILKTGDKSEENKTVRDSLFRGHLSNIHSMVEAGNLIVAGPFGENDQDYRGIFILDVKTIEDAKNLLKNDPAVENGLLCPEYVMWYGSAALPTYMDTHKKIEKKTP